MPARFDNGITGTILLADDSALDRHLFTQLLQRYGHTVHAVADGAQALAALDGLQPDLVLLDIRMPDMSGLELCAKLKADPATRDIPVIFISAASAVEDRIQAFSSGGVDYIGKPIKSEEVQARVTTHLTLRALRRTLELRVQERTAELEVANRHLSEEITERRRMAQELLESRQQLRDLAAHGEAAMEQERKRIAREIHDEQGSLLTALKMDLTLLRRELGDAPPAIGQRLDTMQHLVEEAVRVMRQVASQLRPAVLNLGILPALEWLTEEFRQRTGIACHLLAGDDIPLDDSRATTLFRIVQESLTNVTRHAEASQVDIGLSLEAEHIRLEITDNGKGFDPSQVGGNSFGLLGMGERLEALGGKLRIDSAPGRGTRLHITIPLAEELP